MNSKRLRKHDTSQKGSEILNFTFLYGLPALIDEAKLKSGTTTQILSTIISNQSVDVKGAKIIIHLKVCPQVKVKMHFQILGL